MLAERLSRFLAVRGIHYGWVMVILGFFYSLFSSAALGIPSVLIVAMSRDLGWSIGEISAPQGLRLALFGLAAPFAGGLMMRYGARRMMALSGGLLVLGLLLTITMRSHWQMWLGLGIVLGIAPGLTAMQLGAVISSRWFIAHRGLVVGLLGGSFATGMLVFMPLAAWMTEQWGWRTAFIPVGLGVMVMLALYLIFGRDHPQELGLPPLGGTEVEPIAKEPTENFIALSFQALIVGVRHRVFWVLSFTFFICGVTSLGLTQAHLVPFCGDIGIPMVTAAWLLAVIGVCDLIGTIVSGWLSDRYDNRWLLSWYYGLRGASLVWLVYADPSIEGLTVFAVVYGLDFIATVPPTIRLAVSAFGRELGPAVFSWIFAAHQLGAGLMAAGTGMSRDALGTYLPAFLLAGILCVIAAAAFSLLRKPVAVQV